MKRSTAQRLVAILCLFLMLSFNLFAGMTYRQPKQETDPVFSVSEAHSINSTDTSAWDTAYSWGDHAQAGYVAGTPWQSEGYLQDAPSDGSQYLRLNGTWSTVTIPAGTVNRTISIAFDGCGAVPLAGTTAIHAAMGYDVTITGWSLSSVDDDGAAVTASAVFTVKKNGAAISGTEKPTLASASSNSDTALTTWTTSFVKGDRITASVDSASTGTRYALSLYAEATT